MSMFRKAALGAAFLAAAAFSSAASAAYSFAVTNGGDGSIAGSYPQFTLTSSNNEVGSSIDTYTQLFTVGQMVTFDWTYTTADWDSSFDPAGYILNGVKTELVGVQQVGSASGSALVHVQAGDTFGWYQDSVDTVEGSGKLSVAVTTPVPEPANVMLMLAGLGALGVVARRRKSA